MKVAFRSLEFPSATLVANEFIDEYMPKANGEYIKVYLYLLRHAKEEITVGEIAGALDLTEGDVGRAMARWTREGLITVSETAPEKDMAAVPEKNMEKVPEKNMEIISETDMETVPETDLEAVPETDAGKEKDPEENNAGIAIPDKSETDIFRLKGNDEFVNLLYVVQRYLSRIFSQTDNETIAYLYDVLKMPADLIEYLAEICAERGKTSLRYLQAIALDWYSRGIKTVERAKEESGLYTGEVYSVMKAFGLSGRNPGEQEKALISKWYHTYGFSRELVAEACARTLAATQKPSFQYTDSILTHWHEAGVHSSDDIKKLDEVHEDRQHQAKAPVTSRIKNGTRFNNFEQRNDDLDSIVVEEMNRKLKES